MIAQTILLSIHNNQKFFKKHLPTNCIYSKTALTNNIIVYPSIIYSAAIIISERTADMPKESNFKMSTSFPRLCTFLLHYDL